uniref:topoisomerase C-terminal repeat-containing protein n=1 Tax=Prochlorothrix hollandica TaxID=1223 RepID=UPI0033428580
QPKRGRSTTRKTKEPLRDMGGHPDDPEPIHLYDGPYGPYVKHGKVNASLPEGATPETLTLQQALEALATKAGTKGKTKGKSTTKAKASSTQAKTSAPKTSAAKTSGTKKRSTSKTSSNP